MTTTNGSLAPFTAALGQPEHATAVQRVIDALGSDFEVSEFGHPPAPTRNLEFDDVAAAVVLTDGLVSSIFFYADDEASAPLLSTLVHGLTRTSTRAEALRALGDPQQSEDHYDLFPLDRGYLHLEYDDAGALRLVTLMAALVELAPAGAATSARTDAAAVSPTGDIRTFLAVLGLPLGALEATGIGRDAARREEKKDGTRWTYLFTTDGLDLQLREEMLVGLLIHATRAEGSIHPRPETLIDSLPLPTDAESVRDHFGTPAVSSPTARPGESFDLYHLDDEYALSFDYTDHRVVSLTLGRRGVGLD